MHKGFLQSLTAQGASCGTSTEVDLKLTVDRKKLANMSPSERVKLRVHVQQQLRPFPEAFKEFSEKYIEGLSGLSSEEVESLQQILKDYSTRNFGTSVLKAANFGFGYLLPMQNFGASVLSAAQAGALRKLVKRFSKKYFEVDVPMLIAAESCSTAFLVTIPRSFQGLVHDTLGLLTVGPLMVEELESNENVDKIVPRHRRSGPQESVAAESKPIRLYEEPSIPIEISLPGMVCDVLQFLKGPLTVEELESNENVDKAVKRHCSNIGPKGSVAAESKLIIPQD